MMSPAAWMKVTTWARSADELPVQVEYVSSIGMVRVSTGVGELYLHPEVAVRLRQRLADALNDCPTVTLVGESAMVAGSKAVA
ncbi:hypothetical protein [Nocardia sp. NPDC047654]|uniref:hypothetical protein n=1 Tax=Nocardia sp. NPDC047654 TaxID=3364314 RepID=UPI00371E0640